jgi:hypothetical protein
MKKSVLILSILLWGVPAFAQDMAPSKPTKPVSEVSVRREDCQRLVKHTASADVAYTPGVDVNGKSVVPAHGDGPAPLEIELPKKIVIDFGIDLAGKYGILGTGEQTATTTIFPIEYDLGMNALTINGKPLSSDDSRAIAKACKLLLTPPGDKK